MNDYSPDEANRRSLRISMMDGVFACMAFGFTANYSTPFALLLGANSFFIGLLNSIPQLLSAAVQLKSTKVAEFFRSRVKTITISVFLQALTWFSVLVIVLVPKGVVDTVDFLKLLKAWGPCPGPCPPVCAEDVDGDCEVGITDFLALLKHWTF